MLKHKVKAKKYDDKGECTFNQKLFHENVTKYVLDTGVPFDTPEKPSFRKIYNDINIQKEGKPLKHMSRRTLVRKAESIHTNEVDLLGEKLNSVDFIAGAADIWTIKARRILGCTLNWIDPETLKMENVAIACTKFPGTHSGEAIANLLTEILSSHGLDMTKVVAIVTDNGSNFRKCFEEFSVDMTKSVLCRILEQVDGVTECNRQITREGENHAIDQLQTLLPLQMNCGSHILNLIASVDMVREIESSEQLSKLHHECLQKCSVLWNKTRSFKNNEYLKEHLGVALKIPVTTRWNSKYDALKQILFLREKIDNLDSIIDVEDRLNDDDYNYIQIYLRYTESVAIALDILQGKIHYGYLLPTLLSLRKRLSDLRLELNQNNLQQFLPLIHAQINSLNKRFENVLNVSKSGKVAAVAAYFHLEFKNKWIPLLDSALRKELTEFISKVAAVEMTNSNYIDTTNKTTIDMSKTQDLLNFSFDSPDKHSSNEEIVSMFLHDPRTDVLMLNDYPLIKRNLFCKYNTPSPSSASVERMFSYATMLSVPKYSRLTDEHFEIKVLSMANN